MDMQDIMKNMPPEFSKYVDDAIKQQNVNDDMLKKHKVNLIVAGKTGTGKSTLINVCFRKELAKTGMGRPVTKETQIIEDEDMPLRIYDTVGLELTESTKDSVINGIHNLIESNRYKDTEIHCVWYCVLAGSNRFEQAEEDLITDIRSLSIPVILVITQPYRKQQTEQFIKSIQECGTMAQEICPVLALDDEELSIRAYGKDDLIKKTCSYLKDENLRNSWINASSNLDLKRSSALDKIHKAVALAGAAAAAPIPLADAAMLIPIQMTMMAGITMSYGVTMSKSQIINLLTSLLGVGAATYAGRAIFTNLIKIIPGAGSIIGGIVGAGTAVVITYVLGQSFMFIVENIFTGKLSFDALDNDLVKSIMKSNMKKTQEAVKNAGGLKDLNIKEFEDQMNKQIFEDFSTIDSSKDTLFFSDLDKQNENVIPTSQGSISSIFNKLFSKK